MRQPFRIFTILLLASGAILANTIFNDRTLWLQAVQNLTTVDLENAVAPNTFSFIGSGPGAHFTIQGVDFRVGPDSNGNLFLVGDNFYYPGIAVISSQESTTAVNELRITLPGSFTAVGFDFGDFGGDTATITLSDGIVDFPTASSAPFLGFWGIQAWGGIQWVDISTPNMVINVSDVVFGTSPTPEPATAIPTATAILLIAVLGIRQHRRWRACGRAVL